MVLDYKGRNDIENCTFNYNVWNVYVYYNMKTNRRDSYLLVYKILCTGIENFIGGKLTRKLIVVNINKLSFLSFLPAIKLTK